MGELRVLLCNDDGIDAPGIGLLLRQAEALFGEVWVVAPASEQSAKSRALTVHHPITYEKRAERRYAVDGTPVDCIIVALNALMNENPPDLLLSGVNFGANLAEDVGYSGTIGCAFEALLEGVPAIAFSQCFMPGKREEIPWGVAESQLGNVVRWLQTQETTTSELVYNVNFPPFESDAASELVFTTQGRRRNKQKVEVKSYDAGGSVYIQTLRQMQDPAEDSDLAAVSAGKTSITALGLDQCLTLRPALRSALNSD